MLYNYYQTNVTARTILLSNAYRAWGIEWLYGDTVAADVYDTPQLEALSRVGHPNFLTPVHSGSPRTVNRSTPK